MSAGEAISKGLRPLKPAPDSTNPHVVKKKRNLPGTPDPEAEVIALSPATLLATNRFVCEICGKGFQRDQNLQLHRRGHNLPWKLRQRSSKEPRKRVYVCPEKTCVHHNPTRALGDLTGIKKHFCRKHGEKKWKCDKCSKRYAVQSDWKAHAKTCGTREYRCDCGTLFSRRDSFITHRAFCDALAEETARVSSAINNLSNMEANSNMLQLQFPHPAKPSFAVDGEVDQQQSIKQQLGQWMNHGYRNSGMQQAGVATLYGDLHINSYSNAQQLESQVNWVCGDKLMLPSNMGAIASTLLPVTNTVKEPALPQPLLRSLPALFSAQQQHPLLASDTSATALLQKAAQMGVTSSSTAPFMASNASNVERFEGLFKSKSQASSLENVLNKFAASNQYDVYSARNGSPLKDSPGGETRDFLGVGSEFLFRQADPTLSIFEHACESAEFVQSVKKGSSKGGNARLLY